MPTFAAVDIGSNSVRLKIARLARNRLEVLHEDREVTRLGESVFRSGSLSPEAISDTITVLKRFHRATQSFAVDRVRVAATSATRDARNAAEFRDWVKSATGWNMEVISGLEEGRLIHLGVLSRTRVNASSLLLIDLGGGSCELTLSEHGHIAHMVSLPLGAVRLTQEFLEHDPPKQREITRMCEFIAEEISRAEHRFRESPIQLTIGTSGTAAALHDLWVARHKPQARTVPATGVAQLAENLASMDLRKRRALPGIGPKRAEIIIAGATVFAELLTRLKLSSLRYSPLGLRDGLLAQMAADYGRSEHLRKHIATERTDAVLQMCRHYGVDLKHANRVREMAESLFASLKTVHQLPPEYVDWLSAAAMLYEVGSYVNRSGRHRHAHYIIAHSEIFGYTLAQRRVVAAIARYLGKSRPHPDDPPLRLVPSAERAYIPTAVALLRIAAALDQGRRGNVRSVSARRTGKTVRLELETRRPAELEHWAINKECAYFRAVFGLELIAES